MDLKVWKTVKDLDAEVVKGELCTLHEKLHPSLSLDSLAIVSFLVSISWKDIDNQIDSILGRSCRFDISPNSLLFLFNSFPFYFSPINLFE